MDKTNGLFLSIHLNRLFGTPNTLTINKILISCMAFSNCESKTKSNCICNQDNTTDENEKPADKKKKKKTWLGGQGRKYKNSQIETA